MIKSSIIALVAVAAMGSAIAPAFAYSDVSSRDDATTEHRELVAQSVLTRLQQSGVPATSVEEWGGLVRAYVVQPDGTQAMQLFTPYSLKPVGI